MNPSEQTINKSDLAVLGGDKTSNLSQERDEADLFQVDRLCVSHGRQG